MNTPHRCLLLALGLLAPVLDAQGPSPIRDDFDSGQNLGGWSYNPGDVIESTGGNPGGWLHQPAADTFGPIFISAADALSGDFRAGGVDLFTFDARLDNMDFGDGTGFDMCLLLRDTQGTSAPNDDDFAYAVGPNIPLEGAGWKGFDFPIPSADTSALPTGWTGGWSGDATSFRPGIDWSDVITSVDRVEIWWIHPAFFAIFQQWNLGLDNIALWADGQAILRNGVGINPIGYVSTSAPDLGTTWTSTIDLVTPGHLLSALVISLGGPARGFVPGGPLVGEILILPGYIVDLKSGAHALPIPSQVSLLGVPIATQGATVAPGGSIHFNNALDLIFGG